MYNYTYPQGGCGCPGSNNGGAWGGVFAFVLVLFILLVIIGFGTNNYLNNNNQVY
ncbi:unknown [Firmicutes bacterium CAG:449]|nr:unknown [Firmicutes bacterium CAG:449]